jgi:hypothetical protein
MDVKNKGREHNYKDTDKLKNTTLFYETKTGRKKFIKQNMFFICVSGYH